MLASTAPAGYVIMQKVDESGKHFFSVEASALKIPTIPNAILMFNVPKNASETYGYCIYCLYMHMCVL